MELQDIELQEIRPFFASLGREKELAMMTAESAMKSKFIAGVRVNGELAGIVGIRTIYGFIPDLFIVIKEKYQAKHLGNELMAKNLNFAQRNYSYLTLSTYQTEEYAAARHLYRKFGFRHLRQQGTHCWMYLPFNWRGEILCKLLPFIFPILPYLHALLTGHIFIAAYRRLFWRRVKQPPL